MGTLSATSASCGRLRATLQRKVVPIVITRCNLMASAELQKKLRALRTRVRSWSRLGVCTGNYGTDRQCLPSLYQSCRWAMHCFVVVIVHVVAFGHAMCRCLSRQFLVLLCTVSIWYRCTGDDGPLFLVEAPRPYGTGSILEWPAHCFMDAIENSQ